MEAEFLTINNGKIDIYSTDDGINVTKKEEEKEEETTDEKISTVNKEEKKLIGNAILEINDGELNINAGGDGLDANGSIFINGGKTVLYGPLNGADGIIDYYNEFVINGGTYIAGGLSDMLKKLTSSKVNHITINFNNDLIANDIITIKDKNDKEIMTYKAEKRLNTIIFASKLLKKHSNIGIYINGKLVKKVKL